MNEIEKLIQELCPDGVEYRRLGDVTSIKTGKGITQKDCFEDAEYPVMSGGKTPMGRYTIFNRDSNTVTISRVGAYAGFVSFLEERFYCNDKCFSVIPKEDIELKPKYLFYVLKQKEELIKNLQSEGGVPTINTQKVGGIEIPFPPITIQEKIVEILDKFSSLEAELKKQLEAELEARRKQYEYYREKLLTFSPDDENVQWATLKEVGSLVRGKRFVRTDILESGIPCIHYGDIYTYYGLSAVKTKTYLSSEKAKTMRFAKKNDVIIVGAGENKMDIGVGVAWLGDEKVAVHDACYIFTSEMNPRYVSHYLRSLNYHQQIFRFVSEGKICSISADNIGKAIIPIPPKEQQSSIADILDRFEALTNDLQAGLPAEIAARRQQYEYYREKLLTFKRKTV